MEPRSDPQGSVKRRCGVFASRTLRCHRFRAHARSERQGRYGMEHEREAAIEAWWSSIDDDERDELMWSNAGALLSAEQVAGMTDAGIDLAGRPRRYDIELDYMLPSD